MTDYNSFYDTAEDTSYMLDKQRMYVDMVLDNHDSVYINEKRQIVITIRKQVKEDKEKKRESK